MATDTKTESNLSFILKKPFDVEFAERPKPKVESPHDVLIAVNYTGICGSDVHYWVEGAIGTMVVKEPMVLGHESAGTIVAVGSAVTGLGVGDRIALEPGYPCRRCGPCLSGHYNLCPDMHFAATPPIDGTLAGFYSSPADFCHKLPEHVSLQEGALVEPLAVAVHIVRQADVRPGHSVVVMGAGPVGLLCCAVARAHGATLIAAVDIQPARLEFAASYAATHTFVPGGRDVSGADNAAALLKQIGQPQGVDAVIDASGAPPSIQTAIHAVRRGGVYVQGGMGPADITFPIMALCQNEITAKGSFRYGSGDYALAVDLVSRGTVDVKRLVTSVVSFRDAEQAFKDVRAGKGIKCLIKGPNEP